MRQLVEGARAPRMALALLIVVLSSGGAIGCASAPATGGASSQIIYADEIERSGAMNAYEAVSKLRHNFLSDRGKTSLLDRTAPTVPNVYLDGIPFGPLASLYNIPAEQVASIRLYRAWEAQTKYGSDNPAGVIEVTTKRR